MLTEKPAPEALPGAAAPTSVRIAVAKDEAFCFTYAETLDALRDAGAELVLFSPVQDAVLPENIGGLYLPGGYPELYAKTLSENKTMLASIRQAVQAGLPTAAECGGFLYLGRSLEDADGVWQNTFKTRPEVLTAAEKKEWIARQSGVSVGSDAFFPFGDNVERARKSGVQYIAQPGGSIRDDHVIDTCNKYGIVMAFTGMRLFHH